MRRFLIFALAAFAFAVTAADSGSGKWEKEIAGLEAGDRTNPPPAYPIVFVGSSSIRMWQTLARDFSHLPVLNRGFGGSQTADATEYADRLVLRYKPKAIVFYSGDNDLAAGKSPQTVRTDFEGFVTKIRGAQPAVPIVLISVKPSPSRWALKDKVVETNKLLREYCERSNVRFVDVYTPMLNASGEPKPEIFREDKLHMNAAGYEIWTSLLKPVLQQSAR